MAELEETLRLVELVCARLCHDLGGLIGTVGNAVDMMSDDAGGDSEIIAFGVSAATALAQRLRLMRAAWGPERDAMDVPALLALAGPPLETRRVVLDTGALPPGSAFTPAVGKVLLNLILLACDCLPRGGTILLMGQPSDLFVRLDGPGAAWTPGLSGLLNNEKAAFTALCSARSVQSPLLVLMALGSGLRLSAVLGPKGIEALRLNGG